MKRFFSYALIAWSILIFSHIHALILLWNENISWTFLPSLLRFDFSTLSMLLLPAAFSLFTENRFLLRMTGLLQNFIIYLFTVILFLGNLELYYNGRYPGLASLQYGDEALTLFAGLVARDAGTLLLLSAILFLLPWILRRLPEPRKPRQIRSAILTLFLIIGMRGGFSAGVLRPADALGQNPAGLATNGFFVLTHSLLDRPDFSTALDEDSWQKFLKERSLPLHADYPLLRYLPGRGPGRSVFLIILESVSAQSAQRNLPALSNLQWERLPFTLAAGGRSANGIFSITTGILDRNDRSVLRSADSLTRYGSLGNILKERHIESSFYYPARIELDHLDRFLSGQGFTQVLGPDELQATEDCAAIVSVKKDLKDKLQSRKPFLALYFSVNSHHPYAGKGDISTDPYEDSVRTTDLCLADLLGELKGEALEILLTSDHTEHQNLDPIADKAVPLFRLVHSGRLPIPWQTPPVASQLDIVPTILDLLGGDFFHHALGDSLLGNNYQGTALTIGGSGHQVLGLARDREILLFWPWIEEERYRYSLLRIARPFDPTNRAAHDPDRVESLGKYLSTIYSALRRLEATNRLWPAKIPRELPSGLDRTFPQKKFASWND
ncbi:MAG: sulfatase-like hydrolase/transferase [Spirochaetales bacterium]|nr:sulfatase-like hydrolase/transferase [Spirochaetales bacterium]